jgi:single-stranded DNA-binding protein
MIDHFDTRLENEVHLLGRGTTKDLTKQYKVLNDYGTSVINFTIAVSTGQRKDNAQGAKEWEAYFIPCAIFGNANKEKFPKGGMAEKFLKHYSTKKWIYLLGYVQARSYPDKYGSLRRETTIIVNKYRIFNNNESQAEDNKDIWGFENLADRYGEGVATDEYDGSETDEIDEDEFVIETRAPKKAKSEEDKAEPEDDSDEDLTTD